MTGNSLKSTTAIVIALSLLQPYPALAQSNSDAQAAEGAPPQSREEICAEAQILDALTCDLHIAELEAGDGAQAGAKTKTGEGSAAETETAVEAEALAAEAEAAAQAEAEAAAQAEAEAADAKTAEAEAAEAQAQPDAEAAEAKSGEGSAAEAETAVKAEAQAAEAKAAEAEAPAQAEAEAKEAKAAEESATDAEVAAETQAQADVEAAKAKTGESSADDAETALQAEGEQSTETTLPITESDSSQAAAAETETETSSEVTTETVTEETSRSSDEEFKSDTPNAANAGTQTTAAQSDNNNNGLSNLQRAGLVALGAAAVGALVLNNKRVESNTGDRVVVVDENDDYQILKDDDALLRQPGSEVRTERFRDGSEIVTIRDATGRVLRRVQIDPDGREYLLFDDTRRFEPVVVRDLPTPRNDFYDYEAASDRDALRRALLAADQRDIGRTFSLRQVRETVEVRQLSPVINLQNVTFATGSSAIQPSQAEKLREMGMLMRDIIAEDPTELFLIEGYTDAVGAPGYNLLLSDRRAESVALAFAEYFDVPAENMVVQGYGESYLKVPTQEAERQNRRVAVRRITTLVRNATR
jgi:outer membrane protein OmpA-like peptidoglycan-associated protein